VLITDSEAAREMLRIADAEDVAAPAGARIA
jgi:hypothetical protein